MAGSSLFLATDAPGRFAHLGEIFLGEPIELRLALMLSAACVVGYVVDQLTSAFHSFDGWRRIV